MTYDQILSRLEGIEDEIAKRELKGEAAAANFYRAKRDFEKEWAEAYVKTEGTVEERRQRTVLEVYKGESYKKLVVAEAAFEGYKAIIRALETRASIGQSLLRSTTREAPQTGQQPEWSPAAA